MKNFILIVLVVIAPLTLVALPTQAEEKAVTYTTQTLPFDANSAVPITGLGGLTSITALQTNLGSGDPLTVLFTLITLLVTFLGSAFLVLLIYAGVLWILARGNEEEITKAKTTLKRALVGLFIILSAYGISYFTFAIINQVDPYVEPTTTP